jgi:hypothetical protein
MQKICPNRNHSVPKELRFHNGSYQRRMNKYREGNTSGRRRKLEWLKCGKKGLMH